MPASVYQLVFKDQQMQKLTPSNLQVGTYTTDSVKIVGSCKFYLVHLDTKKLLETTFYMAMNDGSVMQDNLTAWSHSTRGFEKFLGPDYHIQLDPSIPPKQTPCQPIPIHLKDQFQQKINKMQQAGALVPVHEATPWINSFVLVESGDKLGNLKLCICLDPTNLNKAIIREPYHFRTPEDIAHLLADACVMTVCDCKKGYWHQKLD